MGTWRVHIDMFLVFPTCSFLFCQYVEVIFSAKFAETWGWFHHAKRASGGRWCWDFAIPHRIHGAGTYANIWGILMVNVTIYIYIAYMDPMGTNSLVLFRHTKLTSAISAICWFLPSATCHAEKRWEQQLHRHDMLWELVMLIALLPMDPEDPENGSSSLSKQQ